MGGHWLFVIFLGRCTPPSIRLCPAITNPRGGRGASKSQQLPSRMSFELALFYSFHPRLQIPCSGFLKHFYNNQQKWVLLRLLLTPVLALSLPRARPSRSSTLAGSRTPPRRMGGANSTILRLNSIIDVFISLTISRFDSSVGRGDFVVQIGKGQVIRGMTCVQSFSILFRPS